MATQLRQDYYVYNEGCAFVLTGASQLQLAADRRYDEPAATGSPATPFSTAPMARQISKRWVSRGPIWGRTFTARGQAWRRRIGCG